MLIYARLAAIFTAFAAVAGCGASVASGSPTTGAAGEAREQLEKLQERAKLQTDRIAELEVRVALLEAEAKELRQRIDPGRQTPRETVRIGGSFAGSRPGEREASEAEPEPERRGRPVLRLYEDKPGDDRRATLELPSPPPGVPDRLPVAPLPDAESADISHSSQTQSLSPIDAAGLSAYHEALGMVRSRKFSEAQQALTAFLVKYPRHAYSDNALYWLGEVFYAKREYQRALEQFESLVARFPSSNKMPDSLLKIGMCHRRLGDEEKARGFFRRVCSQYPNSEAARVASREGAS